MEIQNKCETCFFYRVNQVGDKGETLHPCKLEMDDGGVLACDLYADKTSLPSNDRTRRTILKQSLVMTSSLSNGDRVDTLLRLFHIKATVYNKLLLKMLLEDKKK